MGRSAISVVTPERTFVFEPVANPNPMISAYIDPAAGSAVLFDRLGVELRPVNANNEGTKLTHRMNLPIPAQREGGTSAGYVAAPKAVGENKMIINLTISKFADANSVTEFANAVIAYVNTDEFKEMILSQNSPQ